MKLTGHKKVHIAPMGYEIDRIELAIKQIGADRVYLIKNPEESKQGIFYLNELKQRIPKLIPPEELKIMECPIWDFQKTMSLLCELVRREKSAGNFVYINLSSGSKLSAVAGTLASLMYGATPYYVRAAEYNIEFPETKNGDIKGVTSGIKEILQIPVYAIEPPADNLIRALVVLFEKGGRIKQKEYIIALEDKELLKDVTSGSGRRKEVTKKGYARAKRQYFEKLEEKELIIKKGKGRSSFIEITKEGENTFQTFKDVVEVKHLD
ncbi:MAG: hypothetical protein KAR76_02975 [Methanosarcinales archaeon]|nr:hypothetical protein [Methanosarcinales archaeon]